MPDYTSTSSSSTISFTRSERPERERAEIREQEQNRPLPRNFFTGQMCDVCRTTNQSIHSQLVNNQPAEYALCPHCWGKLNNHITRGFMSVFNLRLVHIQDIVVGDEEADDGAENVLNRFLLTAEPADSTTQDWYHQPVSQKPLLEALANLSMRNKPLNETKLVVFSTQIAVASWGALFSIFKSGGGNMQANIYMTTTGVHSCTHCSARFLQIHNDYYYNDNNRYCSENCMSHYARCYGCGHVDVRGRMIGTHRGRVCAPCFEHSTIPCSVCEGPVSIYNTREFEDVGRVCFPCQERSSCDCHNCGRSGYTFVYLMRTIDGRERHFCDRCSGTAIARIYPYNYRPRNYVYYGKLPFYGIEVEVDNFPRPANRCSLPLIEKFSNEERLFYVKRDGSLRNGFELVFHPRGLEAWVELNDTFVAILDDVVGLGGFAHAVDTCGVHVHRSKSDLKAIDDTRMVMLLKSLQPYIIKVSKRDNERYASWNTFGGPLQPPAVPSTANKYKHQAFRVVKCGSHRVNRYQCVNFGSNRDTIEFRTYKGSLCPHTIYSYLAFSHYLVEFAKTMLIGELNSTPPVQLWQNFLSFLQRRGKLPFVGTLLDYLHYRGVGVAMHTPAIQETEWRAI